MILFMSKTCPKCETLEQELKKIELPADLKTIYLMRVNGQVVWTERMEDGTHRLIKGERLIVRIPSLYDTKQKKSHYAIESILEQLCPQPL